MVRLLHMAPLRMSSHAPSASERGFTLIETMVSLGVFMFGLLALTFMQSSVIQNVRVANELALATNLATTQLEEMELLPLAQLVDGTAYFDFAGAPTTEDAAPYYTLTWVVEGTGNLRDVTVTVAWTYNGSEPHTLEMASRFSEAQ